MTLQRYLARIYGATLTMTLLGLVVLVVAAGLVESGGPLSRAENLASTALKLAGYRAVQFSYQMLPSACLLAALIAGTLLARRGELLAVHAAGVSALRLRLSFVAVAAFAGTVGVVAGETVVPLAVAGVARTKFDELGGIRDRLTQYYANPSSWYRAGDLVLYLPQVDTRTQVFHRPVVYRRTDGHLQEVLHGLTLAYEDERWMLREVDVLSVRPPERRQVSEMVLDLDIRPHDLTHVTGDPRQMSLGTLGQVIERRRRAKLPAASHTLEWHTRLVYPLAPVLLLLTMVPWAVHTDRRRSLAVTLGWGVVAVGCFFAMTYFFRLLALGQKIPAPWGAWGVVCVLAASVPLSHRLYQRFRVRGSLW